MEIREALLGEESLAADIYRSDAGKFGTSHTLETANNIEEHLKKEFLEIGDNRIIFLAFDGERPIGTIQLLLKHADNDSELANGTTIAHLHHLRVAYDKHKQGIGQQLVKQVEEYVQDRGVTKITLGVDDWNINAIEFYKHLGYQLLKEVPGEKEGEKLLYFYKTLVKPK